MRHIIILFALLSVSCSSALPSFKPYRMDIQQGNVVTSKMMLQLRPGMTRSQVRFIMGTPLIQDSFHSNRWDYFYQMRQEGKIVEQRRVILEFENEALVRVRGDVIPAGSGQQDLATPATTPESISKLTPARKTGQDEKGLMDKLKFWKSDESAALVAPAAGADIDSSGGDIPLSEPALPEAAAPAAVADPAPPVPSDPIPADMVAPDAAPAITPPEAVQPEAMPSAPAVVPVAIPEPVESITVESALPEQLPAENAMQLIFERNIELPAGTANPGNVSNPSQAPVTDLPSEASPDFFERMLEKIGF